MVSAFPASVVGVVLGFVVAGIAFSLTSLTHLIVQDVVPTGSALKIVYGRLHLPFAIYFVSGLGFSLF